MSTKRRFSISTKTHIFLIAEILIITLGIAIFSFVSSSNQINDYYKQISKSTARHAATYMNGDYLAQLRDAAASEEFQALREKAEEEEDDQPVQEYLEQHGLWDEYDRIRNFLTNYIEQVDGIKYLYVIALGDKNALYDMYLVDDITNPISETGYYEEREPELRHLDYNNLPEPTISNGDWGWLCSSFYPVYDSNGDFVCVVGCDFGMEEVIQERTQMMIKMAIIAAVVCLVSMPFTMFVMDKLVIDPMKLITSKTQEFNPKENSDYDESAVLNLHIDRDDEIGDLHDAIRNGQMRTVDYLNNLHAMRQENAQKDEEISKLNIETYKDALTGVGNKAAYTKKSAELNEESAGNRTNFAVVMVDMNNLKQINDTHGHEYGDLYIQGCCKMVCDAFKHSPVYRIGGDEFAVIVLGEDYKNRKQIFADLAKDFEKSSNRQDADPWNRYSAAVGMAVRASDDRTVDFVMKRADKMMYENKKKYKEEHGSYR